ncbi:MULTISPECIES: hypothetical protein [unclassified Corynebacterium]|uniref:hypothetical protein n=1 Tax=unclassified Corynebacterium TaxID=2624378 RepID=UPI0029CA8247|nr:MULTISPECIES: hypothetical protein [unclassified Corynebacterium]WPF65660.1 hypothetical protein OLX12_08800 [Corynebacterium sp. 22KM0430]WPF68156.1 hypothetical protein OLW90_08795 [Corynebacterium sp. 21KM1197]
MEFTVKTEWFTREEVKERHAWLEQHLLNLDYLVDGDGPLRRRELDDLAARGALTMADRRRYDKMEGLEFLLED